MNKEQSFALPRLHMPAYEAVKFGQRGGLAFTVTTPAGEIGVTAWSTTWNCRGPIEAFIVLGLIKPAWLPGAPGNNKIMQRVRFGPAGPELLHGRSGGTMDNCLTITRRSKRACEVDLPVTPEQAKTISSFLAQYRATREAEEDRARAYREKALQLSKPAHEVRAEAKHYADVVADIIVRRITASAFRFDPAAERQLREHFEQIAQIIDSAKLVPDTIAGHGDNVVRMRR